MPRGRKPNTELAELDAGLRQVEDPYDIADLVEQPLEDLDEACLLLDCDRSCL